jgi:hypothetical protein
VLPFKDRHDAAIAAFEKAMTSIQIMWTGVSASRSFVRGDSRAIEVVHAHVRLDPFYEPYASFLLAFANYMLEQHSKALALLRDFVAEVAQIPACHALLAATLVRTGQLEEARAEAAEVLQTGPRFTISGSGGDLPPSAPH